MSSEDTPIKISQSSDLLGDVQVVLRIFDHIDNKTTDLGDTVWTEPVANYVSAGKRSRINKRDINSMLRSMTVLLSRSIA